MIKIADDNEFFFATPTRKRKQLVIIARNLRILALQSNV
jgi:hypothetical protein